MEQRKDDKEKKGVLAALWESVTKSGGCGCGDGGCCGSEKDEAPADVKKDPPKP